MALRLAVKALLVLLPLALAHGARAAPAAPPNAKQSAAPSKPESATPLPAGEKAAWSHAPFEAGEHGQIAVKVIDDRGIESLKVVDIR